MTNTNTNKTNGITMQYTLFCASGHYRPVSCLITIEDIKDYNANPNKYKNRAIHKIMAQRYWTKEDLVRYDYTQLKHRLYFGKKK